MFEMPDCYWFKKAKTNYRHRLTQINTNLSFKKKVNFTKEICFSFSTNLFLERKALSKELCFLSTGSFFRKKVFFEKEKVLRKSM